MRLRQRGHALGRGQLRRRALVLMHEAHVNVVAAALEVLAEVGTPLAAKALGSVRQRFADDPFIGFAADLAQQRIEAA